jgi:phosphate transport system substrate-binding protein
MFAATVCIGGLISGCGSSNTEAESPQKTAGSGGTTKVASGGDLSIDGSTTVFPIVQAMAEDFKGANPDAKPSVNKSGTGSGFQKFTRGEIDIATASRPIEPKEVSDLKAKGIDFIEIPIAYDGVSVVVNPANSFIDKLTTDELKKAWNSASKVKLWSDIRPTFPKEAIAFHGPTDNHGTYEYFTEAINGKKNDIRPDCQKDQEYNSIIQAVAGDKNAIAYVGFNYYDQNRDKVKIVPVDSGKGPITPSAQTIADGTYSPLSRPLFLYVNKKSYDSKPQVKAFIQFAFTDKGDNDIKESSYVILPKDLHDAIVKHVTSEKTGTLFAAVKPGSKLSDLYSEIAGK